MGGAGYKAQKKTGSGGVKKIFSKMETGEGSKFRDFKHGYMEKTTGGLRALGVESSTFKK